MQKFTQIQGWLLLTFFRMFTQSTKFFFNWHTGKPGPETLKKPENRDPSGNLQKPENWDPSGALQKLFINFLNNAL